MSFTKIIHASDQRFYSYLQRLECVSDKVTYLQFSWPGLLASGIAGNNFIDCFYFTRSYVHLIDYLTEVWP